MTPRYLLVAGLVLALLALLGGCAGSNRYDTLKAVPVEQIRTTQTSSESSR
jgi:hypothetical protein